MLPSLKPSIDLGSALMKIFCESAAKVFQTQCALNVQMKSVASVNHLKTEIPVELTSSLSMMADGFMGGLTMAYPQATFLAMATAVLGEECKEISKDNMDFGAVLLNMIFGATKTRLSAEQNLLLQPAIPVVVMGHGMTLSLSTDSPTWFVEFATQMGSIYASVTVKQSVPKGP